MNMQRSTYRAILYRLWLLALVGGAPLWALDEAALLKILREQSPSIQNIEREMTEIRRENDGTRLTRQLLDNLQKKLKEQKKSYQALLEDCKAQIELVKERGDINAQDELGRTLLMLVAATGHNQATRLLLREQARLDLTDAAGMCAYDYERMGQGTTILQILQERWAPTIEGRRLDELQELLNCGADPNWEINVAAPLVYALETGDHELFSMLLNHGANTEVRLADGRKIAELIVERGDSDALRQLLRSGFHPFAIFEDGRSIFEHLLQPGAEKCLAAWIEQLKAPEDRQFHLCRVVRLGSPAAIREVLNSLPQDINNEDPRGNIPIHEAARRGVPAIYRLLLEMGADSHVRNIRGETTLMHAALSGNPDILSLVLSTSTPEEISAKDEQGHTALHYADLAHDPAARNTLKTALHTTAP